MKTVAQIVALLGDEAIERRIAAAIVLGAIRPPGRAVVDGLLALVRSDDPVLQRHGLEALASIGAKPVAAEIVGLLASRHAEVRRAAGAALISVGAGVVPLIKARMREAGPAERQVLEQLLGRLGGKQAFTTLLASLRHGDGEGARAAVLALRQRIRRGTATERRTYLEQTRRFLEAEADTDAAGAAVAAALKILGFLEDAQALPALLKFAGDAGQPSAVRQEAVIALRFTPASAQAAARVLETLVEAALGEDRALAQTALHTLASRELPAAHARRLERLVAHPDPERAGFVIEWLGREPGPGPARVLVKTLCEGDPQRAEAAARALRGNTAAAPLLAAALAKSDDPEQSHRLARALRPVATDLSPTWRKKLCERMAELLAAGRPEWEAIAGVSRVADPESTASALRKVAQKARRRPEIARAALGALCSGPGATPEDRFALAALELGRSSLDQHPAARSRDPALRLLSELAGEDHDVAAFLRRSRSLGPEALYYVGFHFTEEGHAAGPEILQEVVRRGGRTKLARMARNKLKLAGGG